jgi:hypothetical protein
MLADWRGTVVASFLKFSAAMVAVGALVMLLNVLVLDPKAVIGGYRLEDALFNWMKAATVVFLATTLPYAWYVSKEDKRASMISGGVSLAAGIVLIAVVSYYVSLPTWGFLGVMLSLLAGTVAVGGVVLAMTLVHWYLTTPRLPSQPLQEMTLLLLAAIAVQALLLVINVIIPVREAPDATAFLGSTGLGTNPAFWLRIAIGLLFAGLLAGMAYVSSKGYPQNDMAMMSATGLLYIAVGAVVVGEVLARGLLFLTAVPV